ncbi:hypothetical protein [Chloroflexus sp. Y-396-1]|uniref:hypothetical protein n=1 Tax=Chloroflexus sp. Y-396-1 TaxID=867845 RepID=UPI000491B4F9|nr:hypothetical protein [Chloroflexus sp. Y-396-1]
MQYRWFLSEPPIRNALEQGCTGFNAGAVPLVSERAANPQCTKKGLHRFQPVQYRWFSVLCCRSFSALPVAPVSTPVQYRWFLSEPPIRNALEQGCTGFNAGAVPLVSERAANPQCTGTGLHRFQPVQYRWFLSEPPIRNALEQGCTG